MLEDGKKGFKMESWYAGKKLVSKKEYLNKYKDDIGYCFLKEDTDGVWIAFVGTVRRDNIYKLTDEELRCFDEYRRANNIRPFLIEKKDDNRGNTLEYPEGVPYKELENEY